MCVCVCVCVMGVVVVKASVPEEMHVTFLRSESSGASGERELCGPLQR